MSGASAISVLLSWVKALPDWGKVAVIAGALVLCTVLIVGWPAKKAEAAFDAAATLKIKVEAQQRQLDRIEKKLDTLLLHLIPPK